MVLEISKLDIGFHELDFVETAAELEIPDLAMFPNPVMSHVEVDRAADHIYIKATVKSVAHVMCDRCLKEFDLELSDQMRVYYEVLPKGGHSHLAAEGQDEALDVVRIYHPEDHTIDIGGDVRETLLLALPMKVLCSPDCKGICSGCGRNLNEENCVCDREAYDPRWEALRKLLE